MNENKLTTAEIFLMNQTGLDEVDLMEDSEHNFTPYEIIDLLEAFLNENK